MHSLADVSHGTLKVVGTAIIFVLSMLFGSLPLKLRRNVSNKFGNPHNLLISLANCFAGGVFFSTVILDMFPDVRGKMHEALVSVNIQTSFPLGDFAIGFGFILMLILEQLVHSFLGNSWLSHGHSHGKTDEATDETNRLLEGDQDVDENATKDSSSSQSENTSNFRVYMLVFAISLHSIFEGLSLGLITDTQVLWQLLIALIIHKSIIAFSIGVQLADANLPTKVFLVCLMIFAVMAPIGVGIGLALLDSLSSVIKLFMSGVLQGIATGTFLYVTFFEVLPRELNVVDDMKPLKIMFVLVGYFVITGVCYFEDSFDIRKPVSPRNNYTLSKII